MPINQDLLARIEASADDWGPTGALGNDPAHVRKAEESTKVDDLLELHPISIRFTKELVRDLKAIAQLNGMGYQPLIREICKRFVDAEKRAILRDQAVRRQKELEIERDLARQAEEAAAAAEEMAGSLAGQDEGRLAA
ncbi:hypothetical protein [Roseateles paludis]|jgi:hypothetical protein|uniref:Uncharacterized protein n=1 Tax=Roseateles paludis TaxID=3145238 RepID=A0ABV0G168_9BURK